MSATSLVQRIVDHGRRMGKSICDIASKAYVACHVEKIITALFWLAVSTLALVGTLLIILCVLWCCFVGGVASSVAVRHYMLRNVPEHQVLPVELEVSPMETEPWRWLEYPTAIRQSWEGEDGRWLRNVADRDHRRPQSNSRASEGERWAREQRDRCVIGAETDSTCADGTNKKPSRIDLGEVVEKHRSPPYDETHIATKALDFQAAMMTKFQRRRWESLVCHGLVRIRGVPSEDDEMNDGGSRYTSDLFLPTETPIFNAAGSYSAVLQLVFLKTHERHDGGGGGGGNPASISVHTSMLAVPQESARSSPYTTPPLWRLVPIFRREHGTSFMTGDLSDSAIRARSMWLVSFAAQCLELLFMLPRRVLLLAWSIFQEGSGVFPPLAQDDSEVAIEVPLYQRFHPPMDLQQRLAALNISVFQRLDHSSSQESYDANWGDGLLEPSPSKRAPGQQQLRLHVVRANVYFTVQLEGLVFLLTEYPILSSAILTGLFFAMYVLWSVCVAVGIMSGGVFIAMKL